jgi:hypothetical protein
MSGAGIASAPKRELPVAVLTVGNRPRHTGGAEGVLPTGTAVVALDQVKDAERFVSYPEDYDALETLLVPDMDRADPNYFAYYLTFAKADIGDALIAISPLDPRPENRLPRGKRQPG